MKASSIPFHCYQHRSPGVYTSIQIDTRRIAGACRPEACSEDPTEPPVGHALVDALVSTSMHGHKHARSPRQHSLLPCRSSDGRTATEQQSLHPLRPLSGALRREGWQLRGEAA